MILRNSYNFIIPLFLFFFIGIGLSSCAHSQKSDKSDKSEKSDKEKMADYSKGIRKAYKIVDSSGQYEMYRETKYIKNTNSFVVKYKIISPLMADKPLENSVTVSEKGYLSFKNQDQNQDQNQPILRPKAAQFSVWFNEKRYFVQQKINLMKKAMDLVLKSPEEKWNGAKSLSFPKGNGAFCFFSQLVECIEMTGFIKKVQQEKNGEMNFVIIWDGYPYVQEQYAHMEKSLFERASISYAGKSEEGEIKLVLKTKNHAIFYHLDENMVFKKMFWVAQGISITPLNDKTAAGGDDDLQ